MRRSTRLLAKQQNIATKVNHVAANASKTNKNQIVRKSPQISPVKVKTKGKSKGTKRNLVTNSSLYDLQKCKPSDKETQTIKTIVNSQNKKQVTKHRNNIKQSRSIEKHVKKCNKLLGGHMSINGGLYNAAISATRQHCTAFGLFVRNQRQWNSKALQNDAIEKFKQTCYEMNFSPCHILPHASYLINCGSPNPQTLQKSREALIDEMQRCEKLGLMLYNLHPGSSCGQISRMECIQRIAESINIAHRATNQIIVVLENMSNQKNVIGGSFEDLASIINLINDHTRIGVCLDTCHAFAAGYDIASQNGYEKTMEEFNRILGFHFLRGMHINDSKSELGSHLDRHENIGKGKIGIEAFDRIMNDPRLDGIPMVLETPSRADVDYEDEIKLLHSLCC